MGGSGKTPACLMIYYMLQQIKGLYKPAFLSRGYGRESRGSIRVNQSHSARDVGDEALVLADHGPAYVTENRLEGAEMSLRDHIDCLILDDGYQSRQLAHDINILVINSFDGFGNKKLFPAGPLREPLQSGISRADIILFIEDPRGIKINLRDYNMPAENIFTCKVKTKSDHIDKNQKFIAFTGIGRPDKFFESLKQEGFYLLDKKAYPDHHVYTDADFYELEMMTKDTNVKFITTEKDFVKLSDNFKKNVYCLEISLESTQPGKLCQRLEYLLSSKEIA